MSKTRTIIDESAAQSKIKELKDARIFVPVYEKQKLVHQPSGEWFGTISAQTNLALVYFHEGWKVGCPEPHQVTVEREKLSEVVDYLTCEANRVDAIEEYIGEPLEALKEALENDN